MPPRTRSRLHLLEEGEGDGDVVLWILGGAFVGLAAVALIVGFCSKHKSRPHPTPGASEGYAHYPPYKTTNDPYYNWPNTGVNSLTAPSGWRYENLSRYVDEEVPVSGIQLPGSRFGPGYMTPADRWWTRVPELAQSVDAPHQSQSLDSYLPQTVMASPIGGLALDTPVQGRERYRYDEKEPFVQVDLTRDDGVPPDALEPTVKRTRESTHTGWREHQYDEYRNPMAKSCSEIDWKNDYPWWPLNYEYPWRDPLYDIKITGLYTAANADPENLAEMRLYWRAY